MYAESMTVQDDCFVYTVYNDDITKENERELSKLQEAKKTIRDQSYPYIADRDFLHEDNFFLDRLKLPHDYETLKLMTTLGEELLERLNDVTCTKAQYFWINTIQDKIFETKHLIARAE